MDMQTTLQAVGLSATEAKIYLALIKEKQATAVQLAKRTQVHRRTIYDNINILVRKGLVSFQLTGNVTYFSATDPKSLGFFLEEKQQLLAKVMPTLQGLYTTDQKAPEIQVFVGIEGAKALVEAAFSTKAPLYWVGGGMFFFKALRFSRTFIEQKLATKKLKTVQPDIAEVTKLLKATKKENIRVLPKEFMARVGYLLYDNVVIIGITQEQEITCIQIKSHDCAQGFKNYFDVLWKSAQPL